MLQSLCCKIEISSLMKKVERGKAFVHHIMRYNVITKKKRKHHLKPHFLCFQRGKRNLKSTQHFFFLQFSRANKCGRIVS